MTDQGLTGNENKKNKPRKPSLTSRLKALIKRRSQELHPPTQDRIFDISCPPSPQSNISTSTSSSSCNTRTSNRTSLFIQLGEEAAREEQQEDERRERMNKMLEEDYRRSWPLERLAALKFVGGGAGVVDDGRRRSMNDYRVSSDEQQQELVSIPIPNIIDLTSTTTTSNTKDDRGQDDEDETTDTDWSTDTD
jgi:hypothetical protein